MSDVKRFEKREIGFYFEKTVVGDDKKCNCCGSKIPEGSTMIVANSENIIPKEDKEIRFLNFDHYRQASGGGGPEDWDEPYCKAHPD
ncbi:MAG: hypothetical protein AAB381_01290 [Patescibacteria group bacterium]